MERYSVGLEEREEQSEFPVPPPRGRGTLMPHPFSSLWLARLDRKPCLHGNHRLPSAFWLPPEKSWVLKLPPMTVAAVTTKPCPALPCPYPCFNLQQTPFF